MAAPMPCPRCQDEGWICEAHPDQPSMHDDCREAGEPCPLCNAGDPPRKPNGWVSLVNVGDDNDAYTRHQRRLLHNAPKALPRQSEPGELLFEFHVERTHTFYRVELRDRGAHGVEVQFLDPVELSFSRTFSPQLDPRRSPRVMAVAWAELEREALEKGGA